MLQYNKKQNKLYNMKVTKVLDHKFRTAATKMILVYNAKVINEAVRNGSYKVDGEINNVEIYVDDNIGSGLFSVFCRFDNCNELTGYMNSKHNFHTQSTCDLALVEFQKFILELVKYL